MKVALITLTRGGLDLAMNLREYDDIDIYTHKENESEYAELIKLPLRDNIKKLMDDYDMLIFIMATGIVVRLIAPHIKHKSVDPGVIVIDEHGKYVISLLSGHLGGANDYTTRIADFLDANAVITTSSDVNNTLAVDTLAMKLGCYIDDFNDAKDVTAHIVNGENIGIISNIEISIDLPKNFIRIDEDNISHSIEKHNIKGLIVIEGNIIKADCQVSYLYKRNITLGIGCKRGKTKEQITKELLMVLEDLKMNINRISRISTVEVKKDEKGIIELARSLKVPMDIVTLDEIREVQYLFHGSDFVERTIGVTCVSEPCGYLSSNRGECILNKVKANGITISLWKNKEEI
ncbi:cobalamin biosynthesis protein CbiG [Vallitalea longa]|uniref:Cobalamin biosynthesis protein CbiG n=1 Tax=Vallitalea longa TaxID=2936439 RepID=A0A9W6DHW6_9FIRM|nr:cobalt-precorrin 5A hydrolase [Vallitalea longa]GKX31279.1 cobalamin biosynthesis protein CbiG [Vallitalea longa]